MKLSEVLFREDITRTDKVLTVLLFHPGRHEIKAIVNFSVAAGLRKIRDWNCSDLLRRVPRLATRYPDGWELSRLGVEYLATKGIIAASLGAVPVAADLRALLPKIANADVRAFVDEAVRCYEHSHLRAAVVLSWVGAIALLHDTVIRLHLAKFNAEAKRINPKWKDASTADHLGLMDEGDFLDLLASPNVGVLGKNVKEELKNTALKLRNGCGHPNSMRIGPNKVAAHIEFLIQNVFAVFA